MHNFIIVVDFFASQQLEIILQVFLKRVPL